MASRKSNIVNDISATHFHISAMAVTGAERQAVLLETHVYIIRSWHPSTEPQFM